MIGSKALSYARDIMFCDATEAKVAWIGDSIMNAGGDALGGAIMRTLSVPAVDGIAATGASQYLLTYAGSAIPVNDGWATRSTPVKGAASSIPGVSTANYTPNIIVEEYTCDGDAVPAAGSFITNRVASINLSYGTTAKHNMRAPVFSASTFTGDPWATALAAGTIKVRVYFYAGPYGVQADRIFLQAANASGTKDIAHGDAFNLYQEAGGIVVKELTIPATFVGAGTEDTLDYWPDNLGVQVRMTAGATVNGEMIVVVGAEIAVDADAGYNQIIYGVGSANPATFITDASYSEGCWQHFAAAGITHTIICLQANGGESDAQHIINLRALIARIAAEVPAMKFIILGIYNLNASVDARCDAEYAMCEADGHLWISLRDLLPPNAVMDQSITKAWETTRYYYEGDVVTNGGVYYCCVDAHTAETFATDLGNDLWKALVTVDTNQILERLASTRNTIISDGTHPGRSRGVWLYAAGINMLLRTAASMPEAHNVRAGSLYGADQTHKGTMPQAMASICGTDFQLPIDNCQLTWGIQ